MTDKAIRIGITHGDINGIGYEVIIKTFMDSRLLEYCDPVVYGSPKAAAYHRKALNISNFSFNSIKEPEEALSKRANIINCLDDNVRVELGKSTPMAGESSVKPLELAVDHVMEGKIDALVTAPVNKKNIWSDTFRYAGHTDYLKARAKVDDVLMIMVSENMKIGVVTGHIPLAQVPEVLTTELILSKIRIMNRSLEVDFGIRRPRIAILSLNPHSGDEGLMGDEEDRVIKPALEEALNNNMLVFGPYPADGFFGVGSFTEFDGILAMYHDQGIAPFKALSFDSGVNFTAGLPFVRTSPDHGTAYELAGKGEASANSFRNSIYLAMDICKNRRIYDEINSNPLKTYEMESTKDSDVPPDEDNEN